MECSGRTESASVSAPQQFRPSQRLCRRRILVGWLRNDSRCWQASGGVVPEPKSLIGVVALGAAAPVGMLNSLVRCSSSGVAPVLSGCTDFDSGFGVTSLLSASPKRHRNGAPGFRQRVRKRCPGRAQGGAGTRHADGDI